MEMVDMDIYEKIRSGYYNPKTKPLPVRRVCTKCHRPIKYCPNCGESTEAVKQEVERRIKSAKVLQAEKNRLYEMFKSDALEYCCISDHPKADKAWRKAWERRRSDGKQAVVGELEGLAELMDDHRDPNCMSLYTTLKTIFKLISERPRWSWSRNPRHKYVNVMIDMRDGSVILTDRNHKKTTLEEIKKQGDTGTLARYL
jgi:hypothetical protein